jgi:hypothetical protein
MLSDDHSAANQKASVIGDAVKPSHPENRQSEQEQNDEDDHEDVEQHAGDIGGCGRDAGESQNAGYDGHDEK